MKKAKTKKVTAPEPKLIFTKELPTKEGFYWWTNFGEHTPCVLEVSRDYGDGGLYASNEEYSFKICKPNPQQELPLPDEEDEDEWKEKDGKDSYKFGDELWCYIPCPYLPRGKKKTTPDSY